MVLAADLGATHSRVAVTDLAGDVLAERARTSRSPAAPRSCSAGSRSVRRVARGGRTRRDDVQGIGVGVPGPVEFVTGTPVAPPIMPGWDGFASPGWFSRPLRRAGARRQRREHHGARRALVALARHRPPAVRQNRHRHRLRRSSPTAASTAAPRAPPATSATSTSPTTTTSSAAAATSAASKPSPAAAPGRQPHRLGL